MAHRDSDVGKHGLASSGESRGDARACEARGANPHAALGHLPRPGVERMQTRRANKERPVDVENRLGHGQDCAAALPRVVPERELRGLLAERGLRDVELASGRLELRQRGDAQARDAQDAAGHARAARSGEHQVRADADAHVAATANDKAARRAARVNPAEALRDRQLALPPGSTSTSADSSSCRRPGAADASTSLGKHALGTSSTSRLLRDDTPAPQRPHRATPAGARAGGREDGQEPRARGRSHLRAGTCSFAGTFVARRRLALLRARRRRWKTLATLVTGGLMPAWRSDQIEARDSSVLSPTRAAALRRRATGGGGRRRLAGSSAPAGAARPARRGVDGAAPARGLSAVGGGGGAAGRRRLRA